MCVSVQMTALALQKILKNDKWKPRLGGKLSKWGDFLNSLQQWYAWFLPHDLSTHKFRGHSQCTVHGEAALSVGYCDLHLPSTTNFAPWLFLKIYVGNVCKEPKLVLLQSKDGFITANWTFIFGRLQFWFTTCYLSSLSALTAPVPVRSHHHLAVVSLLSEDDAASLTLELLVYQNSWETCRNLPRIEFLV